MPNTSANGYYVSSVQHRIYVESSFVFCVDCHSHPKEYQGLEISSTLQRMLAPCAQKGIGRPICCIIWSIRSLT